MYNITPLQLAGLYERISTLTAKNCFLEIEIGRTYLGHQIFFGFRYENNSIYCEALCKSSIGLEVFKAIYFSLDGTDEFKAFLKKVQIFEPSKEMLNMRPTAITRNISRNKKHSERHRERERMIRTA